MRITKTGLTQGARSLRWWPTAPLQKCRLYETWPFRQATPETLLCTLALSGKTGECADLAQRQLPLGVLSKLTCVSPVAFPMLSKGGESQRQPAVVH